MEMQGFFFMFFIRRLLPLNIWMVQSARFISTWLNVTCVCPFSLLKIVNKYRSLPEYFKKLADFR
jgi:hypothetical protein